VLAQAGACAAPAASKRASSGSREAGRQEPPPSCEGMGPCSRPAAPAAQARLAAAPCKVAPLARPRASGCTTCAMSRMLTTSSYRCTARRSPERAAAASSGCSLPRPRWWRLAASLALPCPPWAPWAPARSAPLPPPAAPGSQIPASSSLAPGEGDGLVAWRGGSAAAAGAAAPAWRTRARERASWASWLLVMHTAASGVCLPDTCPTMRCCNRKVELAPSGELSPVSRGTLPTSAEPCSPPGTANSRAPARRHVSVTPRAAPAHSAVRGCGLASQNTGRGAVAGLLGRPCSPPEIVRCSSATCAMIASSASRFARFSSLRRAMCSITASGGRTILRRLMGVKADVGRSSSRRGSSTAAESESAIDPPRTHPQHSASREPRGVHAIWCWRYGAGNFKPQPSSLGPDSGARPRPGNS